MKERPILFSAPMVLALLAGTKTQTRRIVKWRPSQVMCSLDCRGEAGPDHQWPDRGLGAGGYLKVGCKDGASQRVFCPHGEPGDRLWVRETTIISPKRWTKDWALIAKENRREDNDGDIRAVQYLATAPDREAANGYGLKATPSIFMPRWASRITLEVTGVRVERLQNISEADAKAEGIAPLKGNGPNRWTVDWEHGSLNAPTAREVYLMLWDAINGDGSADKNPWLWCIEFKRVAP